MLPEEISTERFKLRPFRFSDVPEVFVYVQEPDMGRFLEGSIAAWADVMTGPGTMFGVTKWKGDVWVAAGDAGLLKREGNELVCLKPNIKATALDGREDLIISAPNMIVVTADGKKFGGRGKNNLLLDTLATKTPEWLP